jgi:hypothetical protein
MITLVKKMLIEVEEVQVADDTVHKLGKVALHIDVGHVDIAHLSDHQETNAATSDHQSTHAKPDRNGIFVNTTKESVASSWKAVKGPPIDLSQFYNDSSGRLTTSNDKDRNESNIFMLGFRFFQAKTEAGKQLIISAYLDNEGEYYSFVAGLGGTYGRKKLTHIP